MWAGSGDGIGQRGRRDVISRAARVVPAVLAAVGLLAVVALGPGVTSAVFTSTTSATASLGTGSLTGANAPRSGVATFAAVSTPSGCDVTWTGLAGGTQAADRFELLAEPSGTALFESTVGDVGAGSHLTTPSTAVSSYRLRTRAASSWVSPPLETSTTTCVSPGQISVAAGDTATCGIRSDASLWCWGFGQWLAPADDDYFTTSSPRLESAASWRQVSVAIGHACGVQTDASLWCWGANWTGQLGDGTSLDTTNPVQVGAATDWLSVEASGYTTCGIRAPGTLWCWGRNDDGQMGDGTSAPSATPVQIGTANDWTAVAGGTRHTCGVRGGDLWCWGQNLDGEVGDGTTIDRPAPVQVGASGVWSSSLAMGEQHSCAIQITGSLWCWGTNWFGERGSAPSLQQFTPAMVGTDGDWAQVSAGRYFTCAAKVDETIWCAGTNLQGVTGQGATTGNTEVFTQVGLVSDWSVVSVGSRHVCAVRVDESMWCWGSNSVGQAAQPDTTWLSPQAVNADTDWLDARAGYNHTCARKTDQTLWCFGENSSAQLGVGNKNDGYPEPTEVDGGGQWIAYDGGDFHSCGIRADATLWCWGRNSSGQLGTGNNVASDGPVQLGADTDWVDLGTGREHNCAVKASGTLWCWGVNDAGTVGDGTTTDVLAPVQIGAATNWSRVDAGFRHTCAVRTDQTLWCWGANGNGQVGDGTFIDRLVPTQVGTDTDWVTVGSGRDHSCAVKASGTLWCWGRGGDGQLGDGTTNWHGAPVQVGVATNWSSVDGGNNYTCGRQLDDSLWCWGRNGAGNFGSGAVSGIVASPVQHHAGVANFAVSTGHWHTCSIATTGVLSCWGANYSGQLGYTSPILTPTEVDGSYAWAN